MHCNRWEEVVLRAIHQGAEADKTRESVLWEVGYDIVCSVPYSAGQGRGYS